MAKRVGPGDKIKRLRLAMGLTQEDITKDELSKSIVSMIESNKRNLTWKTAHIIADCLNIYYEEIGKKITAEYLMETEEDEARRIIKEDIDHLQRVIQSGNVDQQLIENTFDKTINIINEWGLEAEKADLKIVRGNFYYYNYQYSKALADFLDVLDYSLRVHNHGQVARMYNSIGNVYQMQMAIDMALVHYVKAFDTARVYEPVDKNKRKVMSLYNQILCHRKLKRYDLALSHIDLFKKLECEDALLQTFLDKVILLEANTYRDINNYEKALKIYDKLNYNLNHLDSETSFLLYDNYAQLYRQQGNPSKALEYIQKANSLQSEIELNHMPALYLKEAKCYNLLEEYDLVVSILEKALRLAQQLSRQEIVLETHFAFVELYIETQEYDIALAHLDTLEKLIITSNINIYKYDLYSFYCNVYLGLGNIAKAKEYLSNMRRSYLKD